MNETFFDCRPMTVADVPAVAELQVSSGTDLTTRLGLRSEAPPSPGQAERELETLTRFVGSDGPGCWVAEGAGKLVGCSIGIRRGDFFGLCSLFVRPGVQAAGVGRRLLELTLEHGSSASVAMITSSPDFRAIRRYATAGFDLHPAVQVEGVVDRGALPAGGAVREGDLADLDLVDQLDQRSTGRSRVADVEFLMTGGARLALVDGSVSSGFAVFRDGSPAVDGYPMFLVATDDAAAVQLLWHVYGEATRPVLSWHWTREQSWAIQVAHAARLKVTPCGPLFIRGRPRGYDHWLPSPFFF